jgi:D-ribose pyranase
VRRICQQVKDSDEVWKMKKSGILNAPLSGALAELGHYDTAVICDAGLPIPGTSRRIDLALVPGD